MSAIDDLHPAAQLATDAAPGPAIGLLMLDTRFPRPLGDIGHPETFPFPLVRRVVPGASAERVVQRRAEGLLPSFMEAGRELVSEGAAAITTSCGFLSLVQKDLADALGVPVAASSLSQVAPVNALLPRDRRAGILTISASTLSADHLAAAGAPLDTPIGSTERGRALTPTILADAPQLDFDAARQDCVSAAVDLREAHPDLGAIVLECTNMGPYAADIAAATALPVFSVVTHLHWLYAGLAPPRH